MTKQLSPFFLAFGCYLALHLFQLNVIFPLESKYGSNLTWLASLFFFPHLVRVLAIWMLGPLAFFALLPADIIIHLIFYPDRQLTDLEMLVPFVSSACALVAFEFFKLSGMNLYMSSTKSSHWRSLMLVGAVASVINSVGQSILYKGVVVPEAQLQLMLNYMLGDVLGLFFGLISLIILTRVFRLNVSV